MRPRTERGRYPLQVIACAAVLALGACSSAPLRQQNQDAAPAPPRPSTIVERLTVDRLQGTASVFNGSARSSLKSGDSIGEGQPIEMGRRSRARLQLGDRAFFELGPGARLIVFRLPRSAPDQELPTWLRLERGYVRIVSADPARRSGQPLDVSFSRWAAKLTPGEYFFDSLKNEGWACALDGTAQLSGNPDRTPPSLDQGCVNLRATAPPTATALESGDWQRIRDAHAVAKTARAAYSTGIARAIDRMEKQSVARSTSTPAQQPTMRALPPTVPVAVAAIPVADPLPAPPAPRAQPLEPAPSPEPTEDAEADGESAGFGSDDASIARADAAPAAGPARSGPTLPAADHTPMTSRQPAAPLPVAPVPVAPAAAAPAEPAPGAMPDPGASAPANEVAAVPTEVSPTPAPPSPQSTNATAAPSAQSPVDAPALVVPDTTAAPSAPAQAAAAPTTTLPTPPSSPGGIPAGDRLSSTPVPTPEAATAAATEVALSSQMSYPSQAAPAPTASAAIPAAAVAAAPETPTPPSEWIVNVHTFSSEANALDEVGRMRSQGYPATIRHEVVEGKNFYRVVVEGVASETAARELVSRLHSQLGLNYAWASRKR